jgi:hypothetical protein
MSKNTKTSINIDIILFVIFLVLKLTNVITWSWWWVTSPLWIPFAIVAVILVALGLTALLVGGVKVLSIK